MSFQLVLEILGGYIVAGASITWFVFFGWDRLRDMDAQRRMDALIAREDERRDDEDEEVERLDALYALPARSHP